MNNIDTIMYLIDCNRSEEEQQKGIAMAREVKCLKAFFDPMEYGDNVSENCARILYEHSDDELNPYINDMLFWIEDINSPGVLIILQRLMHFSRMDMLTIYIPFMVRALIANERERWLATIALLLYNIKIKETLDIETVQALMPLYNESFAKFVFDKKFCWSNDA